MKKFLITAKYTFLEIYRSKLMFSLVFMAIGLITLSYIASEFGYGAPGKIALDVGFGIMSLSNIVISILIGSTLLGKEIEQRTLYMILSKPISRSSFLIGKVVGLSSVLVCNSVILGSLSIGLYLMYGGEVNNVFYWTILFSFYESLLVMLFAVMFSLLTNMTLSIIYSAVIFIVGNALNETSKIIFTKINPFFDNVVDISFYLLPNLYRLNLKEYLIYEQSVPINYLISSQIYFMFYLIALMIAICYFFQKKNLD